MKRFHWIFLLALSAFAYAEEIDAEIIKNLDFYQNLDLVENMDTVEATVEATGSDIENDSNSAQAIQTDEVKETR